MMQYVLLVCSEVSGDGGSEGEIPSDTEGEGGEANDSMSLKAELLKVVHLLHAHVQCACNKTLP